MTNQRSFRVRGWLIGVGLWLALSGVWFGPTLWAAPDATATITIVLDARPALPTNLGFTGSLGRFPLDAPAVDDGDGITHTRTFSVTAGSYTVQRNNPLTWFTTAITCTPDTSTVVDLAQRLVTVTVAAGEQVVCTFTVERDVRIVARAFGDQVRHGSHLGKRNAGDPWLADWPMTVYTAPTATVASRLTQPTGVVGLYEAYFRYLPAGNYTICTTLPTNEWTPTTPTAPDPAYGQYCKTITLTPGQSAALLFGAYPPASAALAPRAEDTVAEIDLIVDLPYDPTEDARPDAQIFLPLVHQAQ